MIDKELIKAIQNKTKLSIPRIYRMIEEKKESMNHLITKEQAAALLAGENGVKIDKIIKPDALSEIRNIKGISVTPIIKPKPSNRQAEKTISIKIELPHGIKVSDPILPQNIVNDASKMTITYLKIYLFENSVRNLILKTLETKYGKNWWDAQVSTQVRKDVKDRMDKEKENRWHGKRGAHPIFYTDIGDLKSIISKNWQDFRNIIKKEQEWVKLKIDEIEFSRNVIAHNNPLSNDDIQRVEVNFKDWFKQLGSYKSN